MSSICNTCSIRAVHKQKFCCWHLCHLREVERRFFWHGLDSTFKFMEGIKSSDELKISLTEKEFGFLEELNERYDYQEEEIDEASKSSNGA